MTTTNQPAKPLALGEILAHQEGRHVVRLQRTARAVFYVEVTGTLLIADLCASFATEHTARAHARRIAEDLRAGFTPEQVAVRLRHTLAA